MSGGDSIIGVSDHGGWAVLVTVAGDGTLLDRRRVDLVEEELPKLPHHHDAQTLPLDEAEALIERVRASADRHATLVFDAVERDVSSRIRGVALRERQQLPPTVAERLSDYRAQNVADWVMYRTALAGAAEARGWRVHWYDAKTVLEAARDVWPGDDLDAHLLQIRKATGPPWRKEHQVAMAAAIVALQSYRRAVEEESR